MITNPRINRRNSNVAVVGITINPRGTYVLILETSVSSGIERRKWGYRWSILRWFWARALSELLDPEYLIDLKSGAGRVKRTSEWHKGRMRPKTHGIQQLPETGVVQETDIPSKSMQKSRVNGVYYFRSDPSQDSNWPAWTAVMFSASGRRPWLGHSLRSVHSMCIISVFLVWILYIFKLVNDL